MNAKQLGAPSGEQEIYDIDFVPQLRYEHLNRMILGTVVVTALIGLFSISNINHFGPFTIWVPIGIILASSGAAWYLLTRRNLYDVASYIYVLGLTLSLIPLLWFGPRFSSSVRSCTICSSCSLKRVIRSYRLAFSRATAACPAKASTRWISS